MRTTEFEGEEVERSLSRLDGTGRGLCIILVYQVLNNYSNLLSLLNSTTLSWINQVGVVTNKSSILHSHCLMVCKVVNIVRMVQFSFFKSTKKIRFKYLVLVQIIIKYIYLSVICYQNKPTAYLKQIELRNLIAM